MIWDRAAMVSDRTVKQLTQRHAKAQQAALALSGSIIARCIIIRKDSCAWEVQRESAAMRCDAMRVSLRLADGRGTVFFEFKECPDIDMPCTCLLKRHRYVKTKMCITKNGEWWSIFKMIGANCTLSGFDPDNFPPYSLSKEKEPA